MNNDSFSYHVPEPDCDCDGRQKAAKSQLQVQLHPAGEQTYITGTFSFVGKLKYLMRKMKALAKP